MICFINRRHIQVIKSDSCLNSCSSFHAASQVKFALASLGNDAGAYGAFKLALDAFGA